MLVTKLATMGALMKKSVPKTKQFIGQVGKRQFSSGGGGTTAMSKLGLGVGGVSLAGLTYLSYLGH